MKRIVFVSLISFLTVSMFAQDYLQAVHAAWDKKDYPAVVDNANELQKKSPKLMEVYYYRGMAYMNMETYGNAISDLTSAIKYWNKKDTLVHVSVIYGIRAKVYIMIGDTVNALKDCTSAIKKNPNDAELYINRAVVYESKRLYADAEADYKKALELLQYDVETEMRLAYCQRQQNRIQAAKVTMERVVKMNPRNAEAKKEMALLCKEGNDIKKFIDYYVDYLELASDGDEELLVDASCSEYDYTVSVLEKMLGRTQYKAFWLSVRVKVDMANSHYEVAVQSLKEIEKINGDTIFSPFVCHRMALCYFTLGEYVKAIDYYTSLIEFEEKDNSLDAEDVFGRGMCYEKMGSYDNAMADYERAIGINGNNANYLCCRGVLNEKKKNYQAAKSDYDKAIELDKELSVAYLLRGKVLMRDFDSVVAAMSDFNVVLRLDSIVKSDSHRAQALYFLGREDEAIAWMNKMLELKPAYHQIYYAAACLYSLKGECDSAVVYLRRAFEIERYNHVQIQRERDFDNVRQCDEFMALVEEYSQKRMKDMLESLKKK